MSDQQTLIIIRRQLRDIRSLGHLSPARVISVVEKIRTGVHFKRFSLDELETSEEELTTLMKQAQQH